LDFGLAKPSVPLASVATLTAAVTQSSPMTEQGAIVGTFQYMSPEQVEGKELDGRSDIFSLGALLYEMLTGQRAFQGKSQMSVAYTILEKEPSPIASLKPMTPPALDRCIKRSLAKELERRWQSASDLADELRWITESSQSGIAAPTLAAAKRKLRGQVAWLIAVVSLSVITVLLGYLHWRDLKSTSQTQVVHASINAPDNKRFDFVGDAAGPVMVSPDGTKLVFSASGFLWLRVLNDIAPRRLEGSQDAMHPFWSPDSHSIGFSADGKLNRLLLHSFARAEYASGYILYLRETTLMARPFDPDKLDFTGEAVPVAENVTAAPGTWGAIFTASRNGVLAYAAGNLAGNELRWYDRQGRNFNALGTGTYYSPRLSPDGTRLAVDFGDPDREIWVFDLRRGVKTRLTFTGSDAAPVWSPDGTRIAFAALSSGERSEVFDKKSNGEGQNEPLDVTADNKAPTA